MLPSRSKYHNLLLPFKLAWPRLAASTGPNKGSKDATATTLRLHTPACHPCHTTHMPQRIPSHPAPSTRQAPSALKPQACREQAVPWSPGTVHTPATLPPPACCRQRTPVRVLAQSCTGPQRYRRQPVANRLPHWALAWSTHPSRYHRQPVADSQPPRAPWHGPLSARRATTASLSRTGCPTLPWRCAA